MAAGREINRPFLLLGELLDYLYRLERSTQHAGGWRY